MWAIWRKDRNERQKSMPKNIENYKRNYLPIIV